MFVKSVQSSAVALAISSVIITGCGLGEIVSPAAPGALDANGNPVKNGTVANGAIDKSASVGASLNANNTGANATDAHAQLSFTCNPSAHAGKPLQRMSRSEYTNTLRDLLTQSTSSATANAVMTSLQDALSNYPDDATQKVTQPFSTMDQTVSQQHAQSLMDIGTAIAAALTADSAHITELVGSCATAKSATTSSMTSCVNDFIAKFGKRVLRHNLNAAELSFYSEVYASSGATIDPQGVSDVVAVMLNAPDFVYRVEYGAGAVAGQSGLFQLNDYEIATRLAYQFWQTTPDDALLALADGGQLSTDSGFADALDHILSDARANAGIAMFTREWLNLDSLPALDAQNADPTFSTFVGADKPSATLKEEMITELTDSMAFHAFKADSSLAEWYQSPYSFAKTDALAAIYGTPKWDGASQPPSFPTADKRAGLVTRAALLATGHTNTNPIMKGVLIRESMLCDKLGAPPANAFGKLPDLSPDMTTRQLVQSVTEAPGSNCAGCHQTQINPLGFPTENFDALGRVRATQDLYDANGKVIASKPIDTSSVPAVWLTDTSKAQDASDLTNLMVNSGKLEACFARQWVRYAEARLESEDTDGCELETIRITLENGESLKEAFKQYAMMPQFRQRFVPNT